MSESYKVIKELIKDEIKMSNITDENNITPLMQGFIEDGFVITDKSTIFELNKSQYLDNGYGNYFNAETNVTIAIEKDEDGNIISEEIQEIKVDNETEKELQQHLDGCIKNCICHYIFDGCFESLDEKQIKLLKRVMKEKGLTTDDLECGECSTLQMELSWIEQVRYG